MLKKVCLTLAIAYTIVLTYVNFMNLKEVPEIGFEFDDKLYHLGSYILLAVLWGGLAISYQSSKILKIAAVSCLIYGISVELLQNIVNPLRTFSWGDLASNAVGVIIGIIIVSMYYRKNVKMSTNSQIIL